MIKNRIKDILEARQESAYRFWQNTGLAQRTAYRLAADSNQVPTGEVLNTICKAYKVGVAEVLEYVPDEAEEIESGLVKKIAV